MGLIFGMFFLGIFSLISFVSNEDEKNFHSIKSYPLKILSVPTDHGFNRLHIHTSKDVIRLPRNTISRSRYSQVRKRRNVPEVLIKSDYTVGKSGILLSNRDSATEGRLESVYPVNYIQTDNYVRDSIAKYLTIEVPPVAAIQTKDARSLNSSTSNEPSYHPKALSLLNMTQEFDYKFPQNRPKNTSPHQRTGHSPSLSRSGSTLLHGPKIIDSEIRSEKNGFLSEDVAIQGSSLSLLDYYPQTSYQMNGRYKDSDVKNVLISYGPLRASFGLEDPEMEIPELEFSLDN